MVVPCKMRSANYRRWHFPPHYRHWLQWYHHYITINPGGNGPTLTINRAKLAAAVLVAVQKGHAEIATDSASSLFQIRKQLSNPMAVLHHLLHRELLKDIVNLIQSSPSTITFYKVKSHYGIIGNEGADHLAHRAAVNQNSDISLPPATDPFYDQFWLSVPTKMIPMQKSYELLLTYRTS